MTKLKTQISCEINDLINSVVADTGKSYSEVEDEMFNLYIYPEGTKTFVSTKYGREEADKSWLYASIYKILDENGLESIYITEAI